MVDRVELAAPAPQAPEGEQSAEQFTQQAEQQAGVPSLEITEERPSWLPEKFASPEALAQAYEALEGRLGSQQPQEPNAQQSEAQSPYGQLWSLLDQASEEFSNTGTISDRTRQNLLGMGMDERYLETHVAGSHALRQQHVNQVWEMSGGRETFEAMQGWANDALTDGEKIEFNDAVNSGNPDRARLAVDALRSRWEGSGSPTEPRLVHGNDSGTVQPAFRSMQEIQEAMRDPRYTSGDPAYHADVDDRIRRSGLVG